MPRVARNLLTAAKVKGTSKPGKYADGGNLYLQVGREGGKSWIFRYYDNGRDRYMGLGPLVDVSLADARKKAHELRGELREGKNPLTERLRASEAASYERDFQSCAVDFMADKGNHWTAKHRGQWEATLATYAYTKIGNRLVSTLTTNDIHELLRPIWREKTETASRLRGRIESVLDWAGVKGFRTGENPARWKGTLEYLLDAKEKINPKQHLESLPYEDLPGFYQKLVALDGITPLALRLCILTGVRSDAINRAQWSEFDLKAKTWTVPEDRTKGLKHDFKVPLCPEAIAVLEALPRIKGEDWVFPGHKAGTPISNGALRMLLRKRMGIKDIQVHGFRSTLRTWIAEQTAYPNEVGEMVMGHTIKDKTERSYNRGDLFDKRARLMAEWQRYVMAQKGGKVRSIRA